MPPTEKKGRVHTSTITVAVLAEPSKTQIRINSRDLEWKTCRGSGAGGQHRNVTDSAVQLTHAPSGLSVRCESERSQSLNKQSALEVLRARLWASEKASNDASRASERRSQVGSGMRGDKAFTISIPRDQAMCHRTGKRTSSKRYLRGYVEDLW